MMDVDSQTQDLLEGNLDRIQTQKNLFGEDVPILSMRERIGFLPISVWRPDWETTKRLKDLIGDTGETRELVGKKMKLLGSKYETSIFNPHLAQMILSAYSPSKARIYDAFGGGGTRGFVAASMGHKYLGVEIRKDEVERIQKQQKRLDVHFDIVLGDSRYYDIEEGVYDFSYSCPPYYNLEVYSNIDGDISNLKLYSEFLEMLQKSLSVTYKGLKPGALCVWVVGNFREHRDKDGELTHFNGDVVQLAREIGFKLHDELIFWGASNVAASRSGQFVANRKSVRVHEYILIFRKPK